MSAEAEETTGGDKAHAHNNWIILFDLVIYSYKAGLVKRADRNKSRIGVLTLGFGEFSGG